MEQITIVSINGSKTATIPSLTGCPLGQPQGNRQEPDLPRLRTTAAYPSLNAYAIVAPKNPPAAEDP